MPHDHRPPSFYHILMNPSKPHLPLPAKFVKKHLRNRALKDPILKSANGGYSWKLRMKKFDDHTFCFVNGWCNVVKDLGLLFGEFLLFKYVGSSVFLLHVYSVNGCEKILVPRIHNNFFKVVEDDEVSVFDDDEVSVFEGDDDDVEYDGEEEDEDVAEEDDVDMELGDDDEEEDGKDEDDVEVDCDDGIDGDPFFVITSSKRNRNKLRFPPDLVAMANIKTKETITLKNNDGYEKVMFVQSYKQNKLTRYYVAEGWMEFQRSNYISEGDECVLKYITSEDKLCLAKVTKKKPRATEDDNDDMEDDDGMDEEGEAEDAKEDDSNVDDVFDDDVDDEGNGENAKLVNENEDDEDDDRDVDGDDGDPYFILTSTKENRYHLRFSADFVALAGINTKKTITLKNLDGYEKVLRVRSEGRHSPSVRSGRPNRWKRYYLAPGWPEFQRNSNISEGDQFVFKFITSEDKFYVAKITKKKTLGRPLHPAVKAPVTEVDDGHGMDEVADPFFVVDITTTHKFMLWLPPDFVELAGIDGKKNIIIKCLDGNEIEMVLRPVKQVHSTRYCLSVGWAAFRRSNNLSEGDKFVFKYITSEDKMSVAKISKKITRPTEVDDNDLKFDDGKDVVVYDNKDEDENVEPFDDGKDVVVGDDKDEDEDVELIDDGMDVDADDNKDADKDAEFAVTITPGHKWKLRLPIDFVALAGIESKENITMKSLGGKETQMSIRTDKHRHPSKQYHLSVGWSAFKRGNNISEGDECVFMYTTSEDKMCLTEVLKRKRGCRRRN